MCLFRFLAFRIAFNDLCCWTQRCVFLPRILLRVWDQIWHTNPNESLLYFEVVFVVCRHQIGNLIQDVYILVSIILFNLQKSSHKIVYWWHWKKSSNWKAYFTHIYMIFWKDCWQTFVSMLHLCVSFDLLHYVSFFTIHAVDRNFVDYCHAYK